MKQNKKELFGCKTLKMSEKYLTSIYWDKRICYFRSNLNQTRLLSETHLLGLAAHSCGDSQ